MLGAVGLLLGLAVLPPFVPPGAQAFIMEGFSSICHQIPGRSPHLYDVSLAVCDRCIGVYSGLAVGVVTVRWFGRVWEHSLRRTRRILIGAAVPTGLDWIGPVLGLWGNTPVSRTLAGLLVGVAVGHFVADRVLSVRAEANGRDE